MKIILLLCGRWEKGINSLIENILIIIIIIIMCVWSRNNNYWFVACLVYFKFKCKLRHSNIIWIFFEYGIILLSHFETLWSYSIFNSLFATMLNRPLTTKNHSVEFKWVSYRTCTSLLSWTEQSVAHTPSRPNALCNQLTESNSVLIHLLNENINHKYHLNLFILIIWIYRRLYV